MIAAIDAALTRILQREFVIEPNQDSEKVSLIFSSRTKAQEAAKLLSLFVNRELNITECDHTLIKRRYEIIFPGRILLEIFPPSTQAATRSTEHQIRTGRPRYRRRTAH